MNKDVKFYIKIYKMYYNSVDFAIIPAIEVRTGNNVLYVHKYYNRDNYDYNNMDYIFNRKKKGQLNRYSISHKSGFALSEHIYAPNIEMVVKVAEKLLKKHFFGFFFGYNQNRKYLRKHLNAYWSSELWKYREYKTSFASDLIYDYIHKAKGIEETFLLD